QARERHAGLVAKPDDGRDAVVGAARDVFSLDGEAERSRDRAARTQIQDGGGDEKVPAMASRAVRGSARGNHAGKVWQSFTRTLCIAIGAEMESEQRPGPGRVEAFLPAEELAAAFMLPPV